MSLFDVVISNPPYQLETRGTTSDKTIYPEFLYYGYNTAGNTLMIHPLRAFLVNTRANKKLVNSIKENPYYRIPYYYKDNKKVFPSVLVEGGIVVSRWCKQQAGHYDSLHDLIPSELKVLRDKVSSSGYDSVMKLLQPVSNVRIHVDGHVEKLQTNIIDNNSHLFYDEYSAGRVQIVGRKAGKRVQLFVDKGLLDIRDSDWENKYKVVLPASHGGKRRGSIGKSVVLAPDEYCTHTFIVFGWFDSLCEAENFNAYLNSPFARGLLSIKKITQHNARDTWVHVPDLSNYHVDEFYVDTMCSLQQEFSLSEEIMSYLDNNIA